MFTAFLVLLFSWPFFSSTAFPQTHWILTALFLILLVFWIISKGLPLEKIRPLRYPFLALCACLALSVAFSQTLLHSLRALAYYILGLITFIIAASSSQEHKKQIILTLVLCGCAISLLAYKQYLFGFQYTMRYAQEHQLLDPFTLDYLTRKRVFTPFFTPNLLAGFISLTTLLSLPHKHLRYTACIMAPVLFLTQSVGGLASFCLGLAAYFYLCGNLKKKRLALLLGTLAVVIAMGILRSATLQAHHSIFFSVQMRLVYWKEALRHILYSPFIGTGLGNFFIPQARLVHNLPLQLWGETGIIGLSAFIWFTASAIYRGIKTSPKDPHTAALLAAQAAFFAHNLTDFSFFLPESGLIWWVLLGLLMAGAGGRHIPHKESASCLPSIKTSSIDL